MNEWLQSTSLVNQFQARFRQYLLLLEVLEDPTLVTLIVDFLSVSEVLCLTSTSK